MTHLTAMLASTTHVIGHGAACEHRAVAVSAPGELPPEGGGPLDEARTIRSRGLREDSPQLAFERDPLPGRSQLQPTDGGIIDVPNHDLGHVPCLR
jgi:hypothetical protein